MRSMTGYGRATAEDERLSVSVGLKAVNHRYLDLKLRLDEAFYEWEAPLRERLGRFLFRGRVDANVQIVSRRQRELEVAVHRPALEALHQAFGALVDEGLLVGGLAPGDLLRQSDVVQVRARLVEWSDDDRSLVLDTAEAAARQLVEARQSEGTRLEALLGERLDGLQAQALELRTLRQGCLDEIREGLESRLQEAQDKVQVDPQRLAQEVAILVDRSDVAEELDRLEAHLQHFRELMVRPKSIGKRLDFLSQEIFRELNTLGAKCRNAAMTRAVLEAKSLAEQLREQLQNVE